MRRTLKNVQNHLDNKLGARILWSRITAGVSTVAALVFGLLSITGPALYQFSNMLFLVLCLAFTAVAISQGLKGTDAKEYEIIPGEVV